MGSESKGFHREVVRIVNFDDYGQILKNSSRVASFLSDKQCTSRAESVDLSAISLSLSPDPVPYDHFRTLGILNSGREFFCVVLALFSTSVTLLQA